MSIHNKLNLFIKNFLMLDVYENMSDEDKEFIAQCQCNDAWRKSNQRVYKSFKTNRDFLWINGKRKISCIANNISRQFL